MLKEKIICGIQQIGIGVANVHEAWNWYREHFGMDIKILLGRTMTLRSGIFYVEAPGADGLSSGRLGREAAL